MKQKSKSTFQFKKVWKISIPVQILMIFFLFCIRVIQVYMCQTTLIQELPKFVIIFAPIYEEIIFRGIILSFMLKHFNQTKAIIFSSVLFGLWHLKNYSHLDSFELVYQISYAMLFISPIFSYLTTKTKTIWITVILHYINNIIAPLFSII